MEEKLQSLKKDHDSCISIAAHIGAESFLEVTYFFKITYPHAISRFYENFQPYKV